MTSASARTTEFQRPSPALEPGSFAPAPADGEPKEPNEPVLKFRNYMPRDEELQEGVMARTTADSRCYGAGGRAIKSQ